ncbi:hypothetical protein BUALT_BualtUnG0058300 [Buddleja alternifolia]|uniref:TF-B3 domain-containing protein n=1 Tax=Buddleja alternifolia TaxID=168488 RepID=A0AAV6W4J8_9LAMI|nr:hypothetical protein BUALT_BualtUnG0058300 [Buddleja alternifolia]
MTELGEEDVADEALIAYIKLNTTAEVDDEHEVEKIAGIDGADNYYLLDDANPHFKIVLKEHHRSRVSAVLKYALEQRHWPVFLEHSPSLNKFRLDIGVGWDEFRRKNGLVMGKTYLFEYIRHTNVIQVKLLLDGEDH